MSNLERVQLLEDSFVTGFVSPRLVGLGGGGASHLVDVVLVLPASSSHSPQWSTQALERDFRIPAKKVNVQNFSSSKPTNV